MEVLMMILLALSGFLLPASGAVIDLNSENFDQVCPSCPQGWLDYQFSFCSKTYVVMEVRSVYGVRSKLVSFQQCAVLCASRHAL